MRITAIMILVSQLLFGEAGIPRGALLDFAGQSFKAGDKTAAASPIVEYNTFTILFCI